MNNKYLNITGIFVSTVSILLSIYFFNSEIKDQLSIIIEREVGTLTEEQALDLTELYLDSIQTELHTGVMEFFVTKYPEAIKTGNEHIFNSFVNKSADDIINRARNKVTRFHLPSGKSFKNFLDETSPTQSGEISRAKKMILQILIDSMKNKTSVSKTKSAVFNIIEKSGKSAQNVIKKEIRKLY